MTAANHALWQVYGDATTKTWQYPPLILWEHESKTEWQQWREDNHYRPHDTLKQGWLKFSHKVEAWTTLISEQRPIWLDLDVSQLRPMTLAYIEEEIKPRPEEIVSYLPRDIYPETGFIYFNTEHPEWSKFRDLLAHKYQHEVWQWPWQHDAYLLELCVNELKLPTRSLTKYQLRSGEAFGFSVLKDYFQHHKGKRKQQIPGAYSGKDI